MHDENTMVMMMIFMICAKTYGNGTLDAVDEYK